jgi:hypothetical protein
VDRDVLLGLARCERLYRMTFQSKSNDGGHVTSKVTMPMMASVDTGISNGKLLLITLRVVQADVNAKMTGYGPGRTLEDRVIVRR